MNKIIKKYGKYIIIIIVIILLITGIILLKPESFLNGNLVKEFKFKDEPDNRLSDLLKIPTGKLDQYILDLSDYVNISGVQIDVFDKYKNEVNTYRLKIENDMLNEYISFNDTVIFKMGKYYDIKENNYNTNKLLLLANINDDISLLNKISSIKIYGIKQFDKLIDENIKIIKNTDTNRFSIEFKKLDINDIEYYYVIIAKYDNNKNFLNKQIIRLNNNKINFYSKLTKLIPSKYINYPDDDTIIDIPDIIDNSDKVSLNDLLNSSITIPITTNPITTNPITTTTELYRLQNTKINENTSLKEASIILKEFKSSELLDVYKLIIKNKFLENNKDTIKVLENINEYSTMKFLDSDIGDNRNTFIRKYEQNYYAYQSDEIKELLKYLYDLIESYNDCNDYICTLSTPKLDIKDSNDLLYYYKIGIGYVRLDVLGNEIYSPLSSYKDENGNVLITLDDNKLTLEEELTTGDSLYNKLKLVNNLETSRLKNIIGSNYPNNFNISEQNLKDYVNLDEYNKNKYSPIQVNIDILDKPTTTQQIITTNPIKTTTTSSSFIGEYLNSEKNINELLNL
jgi:hypothetical protein